MWQVAVLFDVLQLQPFHVFKAWPDAAFLLLSLGFTLTRKVFFL